MNAFDCAETFRRLADYLDRELSAVELALVEEHLKACEICASEFQFEEALLRDLKAKARDCRAPEHVRAAVFALIERSGSAQA